MPLTRENLEDPQWNAKRTALQVELQNAILKLLDHMNWPAKLTLPLNTLEIQIEIKPAAKPTGQTQ